MPKTDVLGSITHDWKILHHKSHVYFLGLNLGFRRERQAIDRLSHRIIIIIIIIILLLISLEFFIDIILPVALWPWG